MTESEAIKATIAGAAVLTTAILTLRYGAPHPLPKVAGRAARARRARGRRTAQPQLSGAAAVAVAQALTDVFPPTGNRPRIFTGEPGQLEQRPHGGVRALRLLGGLAILSFAGAVGLLALVRAIVAMASRLGG